MRDEYNFEYEDLLMGLTSPILKKIDCLRIHEMAQYQGCGKFTRDQIEKAMLIAVMWQICKILDRH